MALTARIISKSKDSDESVTILVDFEEDGKPIAMRQSIKVSLRSSVAEIRAQVEARGAQLRGANNSEKDVDALIGQIIQIPDQIPAAPRV